MQKKAPEGPRFTALHWVFFGWSIATQWNTWGVFCLYFFTTSGAVEKNACSPDSATIRLTGQCLRQRRECHTLKDNPVILGDVTRWYLTYAGFIISNWAYSFATVYVTQTDLWIQIFYRGARGVIIEPDGVYRFLSFFIAGCCRLRCDGKLIVLLPWLMERQINAVGHRTCDQGSIQIWKCKKGATPNNRYLSIFTKKLDVLTFLPRKISKFYDKKIYESSIGKQKKTFKKSIFGPFITNI